MPKEPGAHQGVRETGSGSDGLNEACYLPVQIAGAATRLSRDIGDAGLAIGLKQHRGYQAGLAFAAQKRRKNRRKSCHLYVLLGLDDTKRVVRIAPDSLGPARAGSRPAVGTHK